MIEQEVQRFSRRCAATGRQLQPGESYYSVLVEQGGIWQRLDYAADAWPGPPEGALAWWKSRIAERGARRPHWAPNDVLLSFFDELAEQPQHQDLRYVLALLLVRRRVMRLVETVADSHGQKLVLYCPRREETYHVPVATPSEQRIENIQQQLCSLLEQ